MKQGSNRETRCRKPLLGMLGMCVVGLLTTGCAQYHPRSISAALTLNDFETRRLEGPQLQQFLQNRAGIEHWPPQSWDLHLLTLAAFYYNPDLDVARARWGVARAGMITAGEHPNPSVSVLAGYNASSAAGITPWIPEVVLDIPVETAGKRGIRVSEARNLSEAARLNVLFAAWQVRSRLRRSFLDLFVAQEMDSLLTKERELQAESVHLLQLLLAAGEVSPNQVTQARIALDRGRLAAFEAAQQSKQARIHLADAVGVPTKALDGITFSFDGVQQVEPRLPPNEIRRRALVHRSDVLSALSEYEASQAALQLEIARQYPDINVGPGYQLDQTDSKWTLGLNLTLPILNRNKGPIAEAEARRTETAARFLALQSKVIGEIESAVASYRAAIERTRTADALLTNLKDREASAGSAYRLGEISMLELLGVQLELASSEIARLDALARAQQAVGELEDAMQSPLDMKEWLLGMPGRISKKEELRDG
jgi:outer membrane protein, heavy metal efflux system